VLTRDPYKIICDLLYNWEDWQEVCEWNESAG
jgi:hypothetical protein